MTSDSGGSLLLRQADRRLGLLKQVRQALVDPRRPVQLESLRLAQREIEGRVRRRLNRAVKGLLNSLSTISKNNPKR